MAITYTKNFATPYRLRYDASGDGSAAKSRTALLADCAAGPLKAYLARVLDWSGIGITDKNVSVVIVNEQTPDAAQVLFHTDDMTTTIVTSGLLSFELTFHHSIER